MRALWAGSVVPVLCKCLSRAPWIFRWVGGTQRMGTFPSSTVIRIDWQCKSSLSSFQIFLQGLKPPFVPAVTLVPCWEVLAACWFLLFGCPWMGRWSCAIFVSEYVLPVCAICPLTVSVDKMLHFESRGSSRPPRMPPGVKADVRRVPQPPWKPRGCSFQSTGATWVPHPRDLLSRVRCPGVFVCIPPPNSKHSYNRKKSWKDSTSRIKFSWKISWESDPSLPARLWLHWSGAPTQPVSIPSGGGQVTRTPRSQSGWGLWHQAWVWIRFTQ